MAGKITAFVLIFLIFTCTGSRKYQMTPEAREIKNHLNHYEYPARINLLPETPYQTPAFIFEANVPGNALLILGGTHGDEPAGYEAALRLLENLRKDAPKKGKVILIPLANVLAVENFNRRVTVPEGSDQEKGNLNRCYPGDPDGLPMEQLAYHIQQLAAEHHVDVFIDLHEARYLHLNTPPESEREKGLGQTLIYYPNEKSSWLLLNLLDYINDTIDDKDEKFSGLERPILNSASWWVGKNLDVAAFTFETSRSLALPRRIDFHVKLVHFVFDFYGIW